MASRLSPFLLRSFGRPTTILRQPASLRVPAVAAGARAAYSSDAVPPPPPLLSKIKDDLKAAMRAKDTNRLAVLRAVLAAALNASKTDKPFRTDAQVVGLLRKSAGKSADAAAEFRGAGREDLAEKEEAQRKILEEYADSASGRKVSGEELREVVVKAKAALLADGIAEKAVMGSLMKLLFMPGGPLDGTSVDKKELVDIIKQVSG
ncbi:hypothetical protein N0V88_003110 [Collariella sp. IMI 366227]|nr:hypothetical protein N0V88_003110 [Collariella sp. IMI 366227]